MGNTCDLVREVKTLEVPEGFEQLSVRDSRGRIVFLYDGLQIDARQVEYLWAAGSMQKAIARVVSTSYVDGTLWKVSANDLFMREFTFGTDISVRTLMKEMAVYAKCF
jgi:hypothetical protein